MLDDAGELSPDDDVDDVDDDDSEDAWLDDVSLEQIGHLVHWTDDVLARVRARATPSPLGASAAGAAAPTHREVHAAMREGFDELGTDADDRAGAPRTSPPRAARGATAVLLGATSPAAVSPAAAPAATSVADFVQRLQLLWLRNSPAAVPDARQPARRWRRAEGEDDDDDDDGDDEALPPAETLYESDHERPRVSRRLGSGAGKPPAAAGHAADYAAGARWSGRAASKRDRSPVEGHATRNAVPREQ